MNPIQDQSLSPSQVTELTQAMLSVAMVDGIAPAEAALIGQFYETSRTDDMPTTASLLSASAPQVFDAKAWEGSSAAVADTVVLMCLMTAHADGHLSPGERDLSWSIAQTLGLDAMRFEDLLAQVRDQLIGALSHLPDAGSIANVVKELSAE